AVFDRLELDHLHVAARSKGAVLVEHVGDAAAHAGCEVSTRLAEDDDATSGHVLAAVVAHALDDRVAARVTDTEALRRDAAEVRLAADRAVHHDVADEDVLLGCERAVARRVDDDASARQALADVVVGVALELELDALREEGAEALPRGADEFEAHRALGHQRLAV